MAITVNRDDTLPTEEGDLTVWRLISAAHGVGASAGLVVYREPPNGETPAMGGSHDLAEIHYVLSGRGYLLEDGTQIPLKAGDALVIEAGRRHVMWGSAEDPLVAFYVALTP